MSNYLKIKPVLVTQTRFPKYKEYNSTLFIKCYYYWSQCRLTICVWLAPLSIPHFTRSLQMPVSGCWHLLWHLIEFAIKRQVLLNILQSRYFVNLLELRKTFGIKVWMCFKAILIISSFWKCIKYQMYQIHMNEFYNIYFIVP